MDHGLIDQLRNDLAVADYRVDPVRALLGAAADDARARGVFAPARRVLRDRGASPLATLIALCLLGEPQERAALDAAFPTLGAVGASELGIVAEEAGRFRLLLSLNPVRIADARAGDTGAEWWLLSDLDDQLRRGPAQHDYVMGVGGATRSLIAQAPPSDVQRSLDLGTGCGVVALHLALRGEVVATDISERALWLAQANARLNGLADRIEFRLGNLCEPVADDRFELILSNPPFVITPRDPGAEVYEYRDGGMTGDGLAERVIREAPEHLAVGGTLLCLANWESPWGENGLSRVSCWIEAAAQGAGTLAGWVVERDRVDPVQYAETWARDGGARLGTDAFESLVTAWLADFAERRIVSIGLGSVRVRREAGAGAAGQPTAYVHAEQAQGAYAQEHLGAALGAAFDAGVAAQQMTDEQLLAACWIVDAAVAEEREHRPGEEAPRAITLTTSTPIARRVVADTLLAAAIGACDGELTLGQIAGALATLLEVDPDAASAALCAGVRELAWLGMVAPAQASP